MSMLCRVEYIHGPYSTGTQVVWVHRHHSVVVVVDALLVGGGDDVGLGH